MTLDDGTLVRARQLPTGWINPGTTVAVGSGVLVDPAVLADEVARFGLAGRVLVDGRCALIEPEHVDAERADAHLATTVGSTCTGNGAARGTSCSAGQWHATSRPSRRTSATSPGT